MTTLTKRELDVLEAIADGTSAQAAAERLGIAERTFKHYVHALKAKTGARTRIELANLVRGEEFEIANPLLTPKQQWIAALVVTGATNAEIAEECGIAKNTLKRHLNNMYDTLGVWSKLELVNRLRRARAA